MNNYQTTFTEDFYATVVGKSGNLFSGGKTALFLDVDGVFTDGTYNTVEVPNKSLLGTPLVIKTGLRWNTQDFHALANTVGAVQNTYIITGSDSPDIVDRFTQFEKIPQNRVITNVDDKTHHVQRIMHNNPQYTHAVYMGDDTGDLDAMHWLATKLEDRSYLYLPSNCSKMLYGGCTGLETLTDTHVIHGTVSGGHGAVAEMLYTLQIL